MDRPKRSKIAILGYTQHKALAPFDDIDWEIWGLNDLYFDLPQMFQRSDIPFDRLRWFQLHNWEILRDWDKYVVREGDTINPTAGPAHPRDPNHVPWLREAAGLFPLYLKTEQTEVPGALVYPREDVYKYFGRQYFTNSITYMIALAIMELAPDHKPIEGAEIGVWGVDMMVSGGIVGSESEYGYQRPSCEWVLGVAEGMGITIHIPEQADLLKSACDYGDDEQHYFRGRLNEHWQQMEMQRINAVNTRTQARDVEMQATGAKQTLEWIIRSHMPGDPSIGQVPIAHGHKVPQVNK